MKQEYLVIIKKAVKKGIKETSFAVDCLGNSTYTFENGLLMAERLKNQGFSAMIVSLEKADVYKENHYHVIAYADCYTNRENA